MNKTIRILMSVSLFAFSVTVTSVIITGLVLHSRNKQAQQSSEIQQVSSDSASISSNAPAVASIQLTSAEVAIHNQPNNCWMIINGSVYNLTQFLVQHPGGSAVMTPYCGRDGTTAFNTKDKKPASKHTQTASGMLPTYFVGKVGDTVNTAKTNPGVGSKTTANTAGKNGSTVQNSATSALTTNNALASANTASQTNATTGTGSSVTSHNTASDCWLTISGGVYNVTSYLVQHPGGVSVITPYCGKDATNAFATKGGIGSSHSAFANSLLANFKVGTSGSGSTTTGGTSAGGSTATGGGTTTGGSTVPTSTQAPQPTQSAGGSPQPTTAPPPSGGTTLTTVDVANHNTSSNCWIIISNKVYNVTNYLTSHPGGVNAITPYCGRDATNAFSTKGGRGSNHSNSAYNLLNNYYVGTIGQVTNSNPTATPAPSVPGATSTSTPPQQPTATPVSGGSQSNCTKGTLPSGVSSKYPGASIKSQSVEDNCSQELEIIYNGSCRHIKTNSSGSITSDQGC